MVMSLMEKLAVSPVSTALLSVRAALARMLPPEAASEIKNHEIVPQFAVAVGNVIAVLFRFVWFETVAQFVVLLATETRAYEPPEGSVMPVPAAAIGVVESPMKRLAGAEYATAPKASFKIAFIKKLLSGITGHPLSSFG